MAFDIAIGADPQPDTGFAIVIGTTSGPVGGLISFEMPSVPIGTVLLALVVRDEPVNTPNVGWTKIVDGLGASGLFLDVYAHEVDYSDANLEADDVREIVFASVEPQELQGYLLALDGTSSTAVLEASATASFAATAAPSAPASSTQQAVNTILRVWSATGAIDFTAPAGYTALDEYTTNEITERSILVARKTANATGVVAALAATASPNATGRAWTLVLRNGPPRTPPELYDPVPGHIGLI